MPFAAVLIGSSYFFYLRLSRFHARKGISGSGLCPLTMLRHLVNLQAPNTLRQGIPLLLYERSAASESLYYPCPSDWNATANMDNACTFPGHLHTVVMLPSLARDGRSNDSTSHEKTAIHSRMFARCSISNKSSPRATRPREYPATAPASFCPPKRRVCANAQGQKAPFPGSPTYWPRILD